MHVLNERERSAIDAIFEEAERSLSNELPARMELERIDEQCRNIWTDWDTSIPPRTNISPKHSHKSSPSNINYNYSSPTSKRNSYENVSPSKENETFESNNNFSDDHSKKKSSQDNTTIFDTIQETQDLDHSIDFTNLSSQRETATSLKLSQNDNYQDSDTDLEIPQISLISQKSQNSSNKKSKSSSKFTRNSNVYPSYNPPERKNRKEDDFSVYHKYDIGKIRQENLELKHQLKKVQEALDKSNQEIIRLKHDLNQAEIIKKKQKSMISALKQGNNYGKYQ